MGAIVRYLLITKDYAPSPDTSASIVGHIAEELARNGNTVDVLTRENKTEKPGISKGLVNVYRAKATIWDKWLNMRFAGELNTVQKSVFGAMRMIRMLYLMFYIWLFPNSEPISTRRALRIYKKELMDYKYDCIITFFRPYSCLDLGVRIKKTQSKTKLISYFLDMVEDMDRPLLMPKKLYDSKILEGDDRVYTISDVIVLPLSAKEREYELYSKYCYKIEYLDFPTFVRNKDFATITNKETNYNTFLFAGTLLRAYRDPTKMLDLLAALAEKNYTQKYCIKIFGGGDCKEIISKYKAPPNLEILQLGRVSKETVISEMANAMVLINITNKLNAVVPSKIFEMFATCKPIINVACNGDDGSIRYFKKYPLSYNASWDDIVVPDFVIKGVEDLIEKYKTFDLDYQHVEELYFENTPKYIVKRITEIQ